MTKKKKKIWKKKRREERRRPDGAAGGTRAGPQRDLPPAHRRDPCPAQRLTPGRKRRLCLRAFFKTNFFFFVILFYFFILFEFLLFFCFFLFFFFFLVYLKPCLSFVFFSCRFGLLALVLIYGSKLFFVLVVLI